MSYYKELDRQETYNSIKQFLLDFNSIKNDITKTKGIYIYGDTGVGKTEMIKQILKEINFDSIWYNASDVRNKNVMESISKQNMSNHNVMSLFKKEKKNIVIVMDEIDGMSSGEKSGISNLIKLIRAKKTKKQKLEESINNPIICIGNSKIDKKIKELMKVCPTYYISKPTNDQITKIIKTYYNSEIFNDEIINNLLVSSQNDLRKLDKFCSLILKQNNNDDIIFSSKTYQHDAKQTIHELFKKKQPIIKHNSIMNDNDRTIIALLWHENIINQVKTTDINFINIYLEILNIICFADYIDRVTFQKQIWQFNEMSSIMKTFSTNYIYHLNKNNIICKKQEILNKQEIEFTKILTKYSNEYSNMLFLQNMCENLMLDKNDLFSLFNTINKDSENKDIYIKALEEEHNITNLEFNRMIKFVNNLF